MKKVVLFAFDGEPSRFAHAMLNAMDMKDRGCDVKVVVEGEATKLLSVLRNETKQYADVFRRFRAANLIDCVCKTCATRNAVMPTVIEQGLRAEGEMSGHPSIARYLDAGYEVITL